MKKMIFLLPLLVAGSFAVRAQEMTTSPANDWMHLGFGIKAGYNNANLSIDDDGTVKDKNAISSFHAGIYLDLPLAPVFSIQPGLMISGKGSKYTSGDKESPNWYEAKTNPIYLELPVNAVGKIPLAPNTNIFLGAGPYLAMGIAGKNSVEGQVAGIGFSDDDNIKFGDDDPGNNNNGSSNSGNIKRWDYGINFLGGVEISHFTLNVNYGLGLANIKPGSDNTDNDKYKNRVFSVSVGFLF